MIIKSLDVKQLAKYILPAFAIVNAEEIQSFNKNSKFYNKDGDAYAWVPTDIISFLTSYIEFYSLDKEHENLVIKIDEYLKNPKAWIYEFSKTLSKEFNKKIESIEIDFEYQYVSANYKKDELLVLEELESNTLNQLLNMCRWIIAEKNRKRILKEFNPTEIKLKRI